MLKDISAVAFAEATKELLQASKFFPSIAEIREVSKKHKPNSVTALPEPEMTPERQKKNRVKIGEIMKEIMGRMGAT